jgi:chemotaxis protein histidine kinase CheA
MIIQGIGGKIQARSEEGKGSTINIYLPLTTQAANGGMGKENLDVNDG